MHHFSWAVISETYILSLGRERLNVCDLGITFENHYKYWNDLNLSIVFVIFLWVICCALVLYLNHDRLKSLLVDFRLISRKWRIFLLIFWKDMQKEKNIRLLACWCSKRRKLVLQILGYVFKFSISFLIFCFVFERECTQHFPRICSCFLKMNENEK